MNVIEPLDLSLRQRKLLHILQNRKSYITGSELAKQLNVSPRTIRSDITFLNQSLKPFQAQILSERSKGYLFSAQNTETLQKINQKNAAFSVKEERIRYLAFQLCLSDVPISMYDLEDEMYVSHTTLENDLHLLKKQYVLNTPYIQLLQSKEYLEFESSEHKRRMLLNRLFHEDWNYHSKGNAYYGYEFLNPDILNLIIYEVPLHLARHSIQMEDTNLTALDLAITIMYHRRLSGHPLPDAAPIHKPDTVAVNAANDLMDTLEQKLSCTFPPEERDEIYLHITSGRLMDASKLNFRTVNQYFDPVTIQMAEAYLARIQAYFQIDFSGDEDFYITLLQYIRYMQAPVHLYNTQENMDIARISFLAEFEIAYLFQDVALEYLGYYINESELLYLAYCICGALEYLFRHHPESKFRTVICSHLNLTAVWALKRRILGAFDNYLHVTALLPVYARSSYDFHATDLVLTTVQKQITDNPTTDTIQISSFMLSSDYRKIEAYIQRKRIQSLCPDCTYTLRELLVNAYWHENQTAAAPFQVIESMAQDFIQNGLTDEHYLESILRRESISSFASHPGLLFLHSSVPSVRTQLSITTFQHHLNWKTHKIWIVIMAAFCPKDTALLFWLLYACHIDHCPVNLIKKLKTQKDILEFFLKR